MRNAIPDLVQRGRVLWGNWGSPPSSDPVGAFKIAGPKGSELAIIASDGMGWEHVSVSLKNRCPNWDEMCFVKRLFWNDDEAVMQLHPPQSDYVNIHPYCLHLWKPKGPAAIPLPPSILVGPK